MDGESVAVCASFADVEWKVGLGLGLGRRGRGLFCNPSDLRDSSSISSSSQYCHPWQRSLRKSNDSLQYSHVDSGLGNEQDEEEEEEKEKHICRRDLSLCSSIGNNNSNTTSSYIHSNAMFSSSKKLFIVGYALTAKKSRSFIQPSLEARAGSKGIKFAMIDCNRPLSEQGPFDVILHKISVESWHKQLRDYKQSYPDVMILDPPESIIKVYNRKSMLQEVASLNFHHPQGKVMVPKQLVVDGDPTCISLKVAASGLQFPLVIKPKWIDGTPKSHALSLAFNEVRLAELTPPLVLQEFVNHGGVLFKVYVIGHMVKVVRRFSLPDISGDEAKTNDIVSFPRVSCAAASADGVDLDPSVGDLPPTEMLVSLARELRARLGLTLFNLDMIRARGRKNHYYVIDINYFPGYGKMPQYEEVFTEFLSSLAEKKCKK